MEAMARASSTEVSAMPAVGERDHVTGSSSPKLTLVEYGDFGCPYCFQASRPVRSLLDRFDGLRLVWPHFPAPSPASASSGATSPCLRSILERTLPRSSPSWPACTGSSGTHIRCSLHRAG